MSITIISSLSSKRMAITRPFELRGFTTVQYNRVLDDDNAEIFTVGDRFVLRTTDSSHVHDYQIRPETFGGAGNIFPIYTSSNTEIATVDENGFATHISNGTVTMTISANGHSVSNPLIFSTITPESLDTFQSYISASLAYHISDTIDSRLVGKNKENNLRIFSTQNPTTQTYTRNPNVWCSDLPHLLTCISPWNSTGGLTRAGTLVSPRHILFAAHYQIDVGATVRFVKEDGTVVNRTMTNKITHPSYVPYYPDITIGLLDSDVPAGISFAKVLPSNWEDYLPSINTYNDGRIPVLTLDQEEKALVTNWYLENSRSRFLAPTEPDRLEMYESKITGDSGNPAIIPINGEPVLLTVWTFGGAGSGTSVTHQVSAINTMMTTLGGGYQLTEISLSAFPTYV